MLLPLFGGHGCQSASTPDPLESGHQIRQSVFEDRMLTEAVDLVGVGDWGSTAARTPPARINPVSPPSCGAKLPADARSGF